MVGTGRNWKFLQHYLIFWNRNYNLEKQESLIKDKGCRWKKEIPGAGSSGHSEDLAKYRKLPLKSPRLMQLRKGF